jgi:hypothetical protein|uniref:EF-hand domain-containing protein n=1 Tax=viral metagenome TaxID=1070528 RepID=A0A6C0KPK4_9ZZZZ
MINILNNSIIFLHDHILYLNNSKFFAGIVMILLNIGSKFIVIQFSKSTEEYLKMNVTKQLLIFAMAWMGTRDIYIALILTAVFTILSDHLFNEESPYCCVPDKYKILAKILDENKNEMVSDQELNDAIAVLEKAKKDKTKLNQRKNFTLFGDYLQDSYKTYN